MASLSKYRVLISAPSMLAERERLGPIFDQTGWEIVFADGVEQHLSSDELLSQLEGIDGHICGGDRYTASVIEAAPRLKALCKWGTGTDAIDLEAARRSGLLFRNVPDAFSVPVSDTVMCYMLCFARRQPWQDRLLKAGRWERLEAVSLAECTLGVIGLGNVGSTLLRRARAFGMTLLGTDPISPPQQLVDDTGVQVVELNELLTRSDFVSVNCDLNPASRGMLGAAEFAKMKPSAVLINTARGPIVCQEDLSRALKEGVIAGAGLDVFEHEPLGGDSELAQMENVLLSPHVANSSKRACWAVHRKVLGNLAELLGQCGQEPGMLRDTGRCAVAAPDVGEKK